MKRHAKIYEMAGISEARLDELKAICRQYRENQKALRMARAGIEDRSEQINTIWHATDPTAQIAVRMATHPAARRIKLIENSAAAVATATIAKAIIKHVCDGATYAAILPPIGERQFYSTCRRFYIELDRRITETEMR